MRTFALAVLLAGCGDKEDSGAAELTFTEIDERLMQSCGFSSCHGDGGSEGGLALDGTSADHDALVGVESTAAAGEILVIAGDADGSYLIKKLEGADGISGDPMPPSGSLDQSLSLIHI